MSSVKTPAWVPETYAVETWTKRVAPHSRAMRSIWRVPSTLIERACSSGRSKVIEAAQWQTTSTGPGDSTPPVRSPATAVTRSRCGVPSL